MKQVFDFLSQYTKVTAGEIAFIATKIHKASLARNEILLKDGEVSRNAAFILKGAVRSYFIDDKGNEHTVNFTFENEPLVAMDSFFQQTPSATYAVTLEPTEILYTSYQEFIAFMEAYPKYESVVRKIFSQYMVLEGQHAKLLRISSSRERYEALVRTQPKVLQRVPLKYIASYLDMALETLSRVRAGKL